MLRAIAKFTFLTALLAAASPCSADPLSGVVLGVVLDRFADRVDSIVSRAGGQARDTVITAAGNANDIINNARFAYRDSLNETVKEGTNAIFAVVQNLDGVVTKLEKGTNEDVQEALVKTQQIALAVPLSSKDPQISGQSPKITSVSSEPSFLLKVSGVFFFAKDNGYEPYLKLSESIYKPLGLTTNEIVFKVSKGDLPQDVEHMTVSQLRLYVPYKPSCFFCSSKKEAAFSLLVGLLPAKAGSITVSATSSTATDEVQQVISQGIGLSSEHCCDKEEDVCDPSPIPAGWNYVSGSAAMVNLHEIGGSRKGHDWDEKGPRVSTHVCWHVITWQHHHGTDGNVDFQISYRISKPTSKALSAEIVASDITWGESKVVTLPNDTSDWVFSYTPFGKGPRQELSAAGSTTPPFVTVARTSLNTLQISAAPPPEF